MNILVGSLFAAAVIGIIVVDSWPKRALVFCVAWGLLRMVS